MSGLAVGTIATCVPVTLLAIYTGSHGGWRVLALQSKLWLIWAVIAIVYGAGTAAVLVWNRRRLTPAVLDAIYLRKLPPSPRSPRSTRAPTRSSGLSWPGSC